MKACLHVDTFDEPIEALRTPEINEDRETIPQKACWIDGVSVLRLERDVVIELIGLHRRARVCRR